MCKHRNVKPRKPLVDLEEHIYILILLPSFPSSLSLSVALFAVLQVNVLSPRRLAHESQIKRTSVEWHLVIVWNVNSRDVSVKMVEDRLQVAGELNERAGGPADSSGESRHDPVTLLYWASNRHPPKGRRRRRCCCCCCCSCGAFHLCHRLSLWGITDWTIQTGEARRGGAPV